MSDSCCSLEFARGGVIDESSVTNSQIVNSTVQASTITASSIEMLASIDTASAVVIAEALAKLSGAAQIVGRGHSQCARCRIWCGACEVFQRRRTAYYGGRPAYFSARRTGRLGNAQGRIVCPRIPF